MGSGGLSFSRASAGRPLSLPCGRCIGCRLERARQWAVRLMHESQMHEESCFITLTYSPEHLPPDRSISVPTCQLFLKRLRARLFPKKISFFLCGEYGEKLGRPHYHAIIFGWRPADGVLLEKGDEFSLFSSVFLSEVWGLGLVSFGSVSFDSACYVANYATKKISGPGAAAHYSGRRPEFLLMSRRPAIGLRWIQKFRSDVYPSDQVIVRGREARPPRYYDQVSLQLCWQATADLLNRRSVATDRLEDYVFKSGTVAVAPGRNARRLAVRKRVAEAKLRLKSRRLENGNA